MVPRDLRGRMILILIVMTPGIPEFMTASSRLDVLLVNIPEFIVGLVLNIAIYSTGALMIRDFSIRFEKGWASIIALGLAFGIMGEGISVHTFFLVSGNPVGALGSYGRFIGMDWIWALVISTFHSIFSISLPLLLLSVAYPRYSHEQILGRRGFIVALAAFLMDIVATNLFLSRSLNRPFPTLGQYELLLLLVLILILAAYLIPGSWLRGSRVLKSGTDKLFFLGLLVFPLYVLNTDLPDIHQFAQSVPPVVEAIFYIIENAMVMVAINRSMPANNNRRHKFALALGLITPLFVWAEFMQISDVSELITVVSVIAAILMLKLRRWVRDGTNLMERQIPSASATGSE